MAKISKPLVLAIFAAIMTAFTLTLGDMASSGAKGPKKASNSILHRRRPKRGWWDGDTPPAPPAPIHGGWGSWYSHGCSRSCGGGIIEHFRHCNNPSPQHGGRACSGRSYKYYSCNQQCCPVNGGWGSWTYGPCSKTCDTGVQVGRRTCTNPSPSCGGQSCGGPSLNTRSCSLRQCPGCSRPNVPYNVLIEGAGASSYSHGNILTYSCKPGYKFTINNGGEVRNIHCDAGRWNPTFVSCSDVDECSNGAHDCDLTRSKCTNTDGGFQCDCLPGYVKEGDECKLPVIDGGWSNWTEAGVCSLTCGGGQLRFERKCDNPVPQNGGLPCVGLDYKYEPCNNQCCQVHGGWSEWQYGPCSKTCSTGTIIKSRTCTNPEPSCGGDDCEGIDSVMEVCQVRSCDNCTMPNELFLAQRTGILMDEQTIMNQVSGMLSSGDPYFDHGKKIPYECQHGFQFNINANSTVPTVNCDNGQWYGGKDCTDMNECDMEIHACNPLVSKCTNTIGSYQCPCIDGFEVDDESHECLDINECKQAPSPCDQLCRNDKGSFQCYCKDGYELNDTTSLCQRKYQDCSKLPNLPNGEVDCNNYITGKSCDLTCQDGYEFTTSEDPSPQLCIDGRWNYQMGQRAFPTCQASAASWMEDFFSFLTDETCEVGADIGATALGDTGDLQVDSAECVPLDIGFKRQAVGVIIIRFVVRKQLNATCGEGCFKEESKENERNILSTVTSPNFHVEIQAENVTINTNFTAITSENVIHEDTKRICSSEHRLINGICSTCPAGYTYNVSTESCDPCAFGTYKDSPGPGRCEKCTEGLYTRTRGATICEEKCPPGTYSGDGFPPCVNCPKGTYQNEEGADFCYQCDFEWTTTTTGATSLDFCGCPSGSFGQSCIYNCSCTNGGSCTADGCVCPTGWTGVDCSLPEECESTYYVGFLDNYREKKHRKIYILSETEPVHILGQVIEFGSPKEPLDREIEALNYTTLKLSADSSEIGEIKTSPDIASEVIGINEEYGSMDAFSAIPTPTDSPHEYIAVSIATNPFFIGKLNGIILIIGNEDNTAVEMVLSVDAVIEHNGTKLTQKGRTTYNATVNRNQKLLVSSGGDLTGTRVASSSGLSVFSGHECGLVPTDNIQAGCDHLVEQIPPTSIWGTEYILSPFLGRTAGSLVKIVAAEDSTLISIQCTNGGEEMTEELATIGTNESYNFVHQHSSYCRVSSNQPILVAQFSMARDNNEDIGAPFMLLVPDVDKSLDSTSFISIDTSHHRFQHFTTFIIEGDHLDTSVLVDGSPIELEGTSHQAIDFGSNKTYLIIRMSVGEGYHHLQHSMFGRVFGLMVYGFTRDASYGYSMGYHQAVPCKPKKSSL